jgi:hydrogenase-4 component B
LLFMGAGSVVSATKTKNVEDLGGLIKQMPWTALLFLIGAISIAGLPPFNGFISEWLTMQSLLSSYQIPSTILQISIAFASLPFALTIGIAAATFVKLFGMTFLSKARSKHAINIKEVPRSMILGMSILAAICVLLGVIPFLGISLISTAFHLSSQPSSPFDAMTVQNHSGMSFASLSMPVVIIIISSVAIAIFGFIRVLSGHTRKTTYGTWDCGFGGLDSRMEYTATSLSQPIRAVFKVFFKPHNQIEREPFREKNLYMLKTIKIETVTKNIFEDMLYLPIVSSFVFFFDKIRRLQTGKINAYLLYMMITIVLLLLFVRLNNA